MRIGQDRLQRGDAVRRHSALEAVSLQGGLGVGACQPARLPPAIQPRREGQVTLDPRLQVGVAHRLEILAVGVQETRQALVDQGAFPCGPKTVGRQRNQPTGQRVEAARRHYLRGRNAGNGEEQHYQSGQGHNQ